MECKFCGQPRKLVKAHAIPEAFFRELREGQRPPKLVNTSDGLPGRRSRIGVYDRGILCEVCEPKFGPGDSYAVELLLHRIGQFSEMRHQGEIVARVLADYDYTMLKLFFLSVLWRASVSTQPYYGKVSIRPPHDAAILRHLINGKPGGADDYSIVLSIFESKRNLDFIKKTMLGPLPETWDGINAFRFYFGGIVAYVKVDERPFGRDLRGMAISPDSPLTIVTRDFDSSSDLKLMMTLGRKVER